MKRFLLRSLPAVAVIGLTATVNAQNRGVAVNATGAAPNDMAILDVSSTTKGMLIPRMTLAQRNAIAAPIPQGLTVYVDDAVNTNDGFWIREYNTWVRLDIGADGWDINGNNVGAPATDFFGTRDNVDLVFRTNNAQVMRVSGTTVNNGRYTHIGTNITAPNEQLDIGSGSPSTGALRIYNPAPGTWAATNPMVKYAATNTQGTIHFRPIGALGATGDSLEATFNPPGYPTQQSRDVVMWNGHWGNITGTAPVLNTATAHSGGWKRLENEYIEIFNKAFTQQATPVCGNTPVELTQGSTTYTSGLLAADALLINPYKFDVAGRRYRAQYLFLPDELNVERNQLVLGNLNATGGLCAGSPMNSIGFYVNMNVTTQTRAANVTITVKHAPLGTTMLTGFDDSVDPAQGCFNNAALNPFPTAGGPGWKNYTLTTPFTWDGERPVIVEVAVHQAAAGGGGTLPGGLPIRYSTTGTTTTYSAYTTFPAGIGAPGSPCNPNVPTFSTCASANAATALNSLCGTYGASNYRPTIQWGGTVANATPAVTGNNAYIWYNGALLAEATTAPTPWSRLTAPYSYRGPGTLSAENGVYDNGVRLNDHVFDRAFDGAVSPTDAAQWGGQRNLSINEMARYTRDNRHLPTLKGRANWNTERGFSLGDLANQLWTTAETQALYVTELHDRLNVLEVLSNDRPLDADEAAGAKGAIARMTTRTDGEKALLRHQIDQRTVHTDQR